MRFRTLVICLLVVFSSSTHAWSAGSRSITKIFARIHEEVAEQLAKEEEERKDSVDDDAVAESSVDASEESEESTDSPSYKIATFGNGCFWCTEAIFEELHGVRRVVSGYTGGRIPNPNYKQVCTGLTGHAEAIHLEYDPEVISYGKLLEVFWRTHDPTTLNRQGPDVGTQYRSAIFYHDREQFKIAKAYLQELNKARAFRKPVVTKLEKYTKFYPAENYHQDYFEQNGRAPYCQRMIRPKLTKFRRAFSDELERNKKNRSKDKEDS